MAEVPAGQCCEACRFYFSEPQTQGGTLFDGHCGRFPPVLHTQIEPVRSLYPPVFKSSWCGEYAPANPETVEDGAATMARLVLMGDLVAARALADRLHEE